MTAPDDLIRSAFQQANAADPLVDPSGVADAVRSAAAQPGAGLAAASRAPWRLLGGLGIAGLLVGGGIGLVTRGSSPADAAVIARLDRAPMSACPGTAPTGWFHRGDGVLAVARSADGKAIAVRAPQDRSRRVWVSAAVLTTDGNLKRLPVDGCTDEGELTLGEAAAGPDATLPTAQESTTTTTVDGATTVPGDVATTTVVGGPSPTTPGGPAPTSPTNPTSPNGTTTPPVPTTQPPPTDTTGPALGGPSANPSPIYEDAGTCANTKPRATVVSVSASDPSGVSTVTMSWNRADKAGQITRTMTRNGGTYQAALGPFGGVNADTPVSVSITALDARGNASTTALNVVIKDCYFG